MRPNTPNTKQLSSIRWMGSALTLLVLSLVLFAFQPAEMPACVAEVYHIYQSYKLDEQDKGNVYMHYTIITHYQPEEGVPKESTRSDIEMLVSNRQMHYTSDDICVYTDGEDNFTVIPNRKVIYRANSLYGKDKQKSMSAYTMVQDSLFAVSEVISCKTIDNTKEGYNKVITMKPNKEGQKKYLYKDYTFYIDTDRQTIKKVEINLLPLPELIADRIVIVYNKVQKNYPGEALNKPVKNLFFTSKGVLNQRYSSYQLEDIRGKGKK